MNSVIYDVVSGKLCSIQLSDRLNNVVINEFITLGVIASPVDDINLSLNTQWNAYIDNLKEKNNLNLKQQIGYLPSEVYLYEELTVKEMLDYHETFYKKDLSKMCYVRVSNETHEIIEVIHNFNNKTIYRV